MRPGFQAGHRIHERQAVPWLNKQMLKSFFQAVNDLFRNALRTSLMLFKIIIPISIATRLLQQWGVVDQFGVLLGPVMELVGCRADGTGLGHRHGDQHLWRDGCFCFPGPGP
jgi:hypothetical protein